MYQMQGPSSERGKVGLDAGKKTYKNPNGSPIMNSEPDIYYKEHYDCERSAKSPFTLRQIYVNSPSSICCCADK